MWWVDFDGNEHYRGVVGDGDHSPINSFPGHVTRIRSLVLNRYMLDFRMPTSLKNRQVILKGCGSAADNLAEKQLFEPGRDKEFESYVPDQALPCDGETKDSSQWSCLRYLTQADVDGRNMMEWGFHQGEQGHRDVGATEDFGYTNAAKHIPNVTDVSPGRSMGYLKMSMTGQMKAALYPWYQQTRPKAIDHGVIHGGYTNSHIIEMEKIDLDDSRMAGHAHLDIIREMRQVLQWWTGMPLRHTSTFGVRIYKRGSMLVDHFDIASTHIASAVLQIGQEVDENGGWPLEVKAADGRYAEVYLQPGEMVLYEGARLKHGRPMRLRGKEFANVFSHFAPKHHWRDEFNTNQHVRYSRTEL